MWEAQLQLLPQPAGAPRGAQAGHWQHGQLLRQKGEVWVGAGGHAAHGDDARVGRANVAQHNAVQGGQGGGRRGQGRLRPRGASPVLDQRWQRRGVVGVGAWAVDTVGPCVLSPLQGNAQPGPQASSQGLHWHSVATGTALCHQLPTKLSEVVHQGTVGQGD